MVKKIFNKKIVIVVDHKNRDLNGSIHLGALLYQRYFNNIYLVCSSKKYEIFLIKPDGVILPNASDKKFVKLFFFLFSPAALNYTGRGKKKLKKKN